MKLRRRPRGSGALSAAFAVAMMLATGAAAASSGGVDRVLGSARNAVYGSKGSGADTAAGIDHAAAVVGENAENQPQAPGLPNAVDHIGGPGHPHGDPTGGDSHIGNSSAGGSGGNGSSGGSGSSDGGGGGSHGTSGGGSPHGGHAGHSHHTGGDAPNGFHAGGGGAGTHATGAVGKGAGESNDTTS